MSILGFRVSILGFSSVDFWILGFRVKGFQHSISKFEKGFQSPISNFDVRFSEPDFNFLTKVFGARFLQIWLQNYQNLTKKQF